MLILLVALAVLQGSHSTGPLELSIKTDEGEEHQLDGYLAYYQLSVGINQIMAFKTEQAIKYILPTPTIIQELSYMQYTFIQLIYGLIKDDNVYSNIFLEFLASKVPPTQSIISSKLLSSMKLTENEFYITVKKVAKGTRGGLVNIPHYVSKEFVTLDKKYRFFRRACLEGNKRVVQWFLENGYDIRDRYEILHSIWESSHKEIIKLLIANGILKDGITTEMAKWINKNSETLLHYAAETNSLTGSIAIANLANVGIQMNSLDINGCSPLCRALSVNSSLEIMDALLLKGAHINSFSDSQENLLQIAIRNRNIPAVKLLLYKGASINEKNKFGTSALQYSEILGLTTVILQLQENMLPNREVDSLDSVLSALWLSSLSYKSLGNECLEKNDNNEHLKLWIESLTLITRILLSHEESAFNFENEKVALLKLVIAYGNNSLESVQYLLGAMSDPVKTIDENMLLITAASRGHENIVRYLLNIGCAVDLRNSDNETALYIAAFHGNKNIVEILLNKTTDVDASTIEGMTPLHTAAENGHLDVVQILVQRNANITAKSKSGQTPLHFAAKSNRESVVQYILTLIDDIKTS